MIPGAWFKRLDEVPTIAGDHDEAGSGQDEFYLVTSGRARLTLAGEEHVAPADTAVAVTDPAVRRAAVADEAGTTIVAIGGRRTGAFASSWQGAHFEGVPTVEH